MAITGMERPVGGPAMDARRARASEGRAPAGTGGSQTRPELVSRVRALVRTRCLVAAATEELQRACELGAGQGAPSLASPPTAPGVRWQSQEWRGPPADQRWTLAEPAPATAGRLRGRAGLRPALSWYRGFARQPCRERRVGLQCGLCRLMPAERESPFSPMKSRLYYG